MDSYWFHLGAVCPSMEPIWAHFRCPVGTENLPWRGANHFVFEGDAYHSPRTIFGPSGGHLGNLWKPKASNIVKNICSLNMSIYSCWFHLDALCPYMEPIWAHFKCPGDAENLPWWSANHFVFEGDAYDPPRTIRGPSGGHLGQIWSLASLHFSTSWTILDPLGTTQDHSWTIWRPPWSNMESNLAPF